MTKDLLLPHLRMFYESIVNTYYEGICLYVHICTYICTSRLYVGYMLRTRYLLVKHLLPLIYPFLHIMYILCSKGAGDTYIHSGMPTILR